jgi:hypothetical protein
LHVDRWRDPANWILRLDAAVRRLMSTARPNWAALSQ